MRHEKENSTFCGLCVLTHALYNGWRNVSPEFPFKFSSKTVCHNCLSYTKELIVSQGEIGGRFENLWVHNYLQSMWCFGIDVWALWAGLIVLYDSFPFVDTRYKRPNWAYKWCNWAYAKPRLTSSVLFCCGLFLVTENSILSFGTDVGDALLSREPQKVNSCL